MKETIKSFLTKQDYIEWLGYIVSAELKNKDNNFLKLYNLLLEDESDLKEEYRKITIKEARIIKWEYINRIIIDIIYHFDGVPSEYIVKKAMKETNFYNTFNNYFIKNELSGSKENIEVFKKVLKLI